MYKTEIVLTTLALVLVVIGFVINPWVGTFALTLTSFALVIAMLKDWI